MKKIFISGAAGLIGSCLEQSLKASGFETVSYDKACPNTPPDYGDILNREHLLKKVDGCDGIVHLAAVSRVIWGEQNPALCDRTNRLGTWNIITAALNSEKKPWIIYASSREVYGEQEVLPVGEDCPLKPMNAYAHSKVAAEKLIDDAKKQGLKASILRFSNVFGGLNDHADRVIPAFCLGALSNAPLKLEGRENVFDFTYVEDVVRGIQLAIEHFVGRGDSLPPIHFTSGVGTTLGDAAATIRKQAESRSQMVELPPRRFDVSRFYGNPARALKLLGWKPQYTFSKAVDRYLCLLKEASVEKRKRA